MARHVNGNILRRRAWALSTLLHLLVLAGFFWISSRPAKPAFPGGPLSVRLGGQGGTSTRLGTSDLPPSAALLPLSVKTARGKNGRSRKSPEGEREPGGDVSAAPSAAPGIGSEGPGPGAGGGGTGETGDPSPALAGLGDGTGFATLLGLGGGLSEAPKPPYPAWARERGIEGRIELEIEVLPTGSVGEVRVVSDTTKSPELVRYTVAWVKKELRYEPARIGGRPLTTYDRRAWVYEIKG